MLHGKQYLLTESPIRKGRLTEMWEQMLLPCGWTLFWERQLPLMHSRDWSFVLLGTAWQVDPQREADLQKLLDDAASSVDRESSIIDMISSWCGRFLLIAGSRVYMDCVGLLGVFYADGALSCSTPVLCDHLGIRVKYPNIVHGVGPDYMPGEKTQYPQIRRLLPDQVFDLAGGCAVRRSLLPGGVIECATREERDSLLFSCFAQSLKNMCARLEGKEIQAALTGGVDSRMLMALMEKSGVVYSGFTLEHDEISRGDRRIPAKLCETVGRQYRYVPRGKDDPVKRKEFAEHCGGMSVELDRLFYARGQFEVLKEACEEPKPVVILRSGLWETCFGDAAQKLSPEVRRHLTRDDVKKQYKWLAYDEPKLNAICEWLDRVHSQTPDPDEAPITDADRFHWIMKCGCWLSSVEQGLTILDGIESLQPLNSTLFFRILFGYLDSEERPPHKAEERRLTREVCPALAKIPYESDLPKHVQSKREKTARWHLLNRKLYSLYGPRPVLSRYKGRATSAIRRKCHG